MTDITIPPEAIEAAAIEIAPHPWSMYTDAAKDHFRNKARAALAVARAAIKEECARVADNEGGYCEDTGSAPSDFANAGRNEAARDIAAAIRAME